MKYIKTIMMMFLIFLLSVDAAFASGGGREGTASATQLLIPVGARSISLAGAVASAGSYGVEGIFWNPANLSRLNGSIDMQFSHMNYIADIDVIYGAVGFDAGNLGSIGFAIKSLNVGDIEKTTVANPDGTGATFTPTYMVLGATYSKMLNDRISVGFTLNYVTETIDLVSLDTWSFNAGVTYSDLASVKGLSMAVVIENIGPDMTYDGTGFNVQAQQEGVDRGIESYKVDPASFSLPTAFKIGLGYEMPIDEDNDLLFVGQFSNPNYDADTYQLGVEYSWNDFLFLRGGYTYASELEDDYDVFGGSFGAGIKYSTEGLDILVDYAYRAINNLPSETANHIFTVGLSL